MSPVGGAPSPATKHWAAEPPQEIGFGIQRQCRKTSPIRTEHLSGSHITFRESDGFESGFADVVDHSVVQRRLPPKMRATVRNGRTVKPGLSEFALSTAETRQRTTEWSATLPQRSFTSTGLTLATGSKAEVPMSWTTPWSNAACHQRCGPPSGTVER